MKTIITLFISFFVFVSHAQVSFAITSSVCVNSTIQVAASNGTFSSPSYTWSSSPVGIVFSNTNSASPVLTFTAAGNYTVLVTATSGTDTSTFQNTMSVKALPNLNIQPTSNGVCAGYTSTITVFGAASYTWTGSSFTGAVTQQSVSVGAGTYTVSGHNSSGCMNTSTISITLQPPLNIFISPSSPTTCIISNSSTIYPYNSFKTVYLNPSGAQAYTIFPADGVIFPPFPTNVFTISPSVTTQYTIVGSTAVCSGTGVVTVSVIPQYTIAATPSLATICLGSAITLSVSQTGTPSASPYTYFWGEYDQSINSLNNYLSANPIATPTSKRNYSVTIKDARGCASFSTSLTIDVSLCTKINESFTSTSFQVYPNPFDKELRIENNSTHLYLELKDYLGRLILSKEINSKQAIEIIKTDGIAPGIYFLNIFSQHQKLQTIKVLKN